MTVGFYFSSAISLICIPLAVGCSPGVASVPPPGPSATKAPPPKHKPACYPGRATSPLCYDTLTPSQLDESPELYEYPDPDSDPAFPPSFDKRHYQAPSFFLDLRQISPSEWLSHNFARDELMPNSQSRGQFGLFSIEVLNRLESLRQTAGRPVIITSGYRSPGHNEKIGGSARWSRHTYGDAVDLQIPGLSLKQLAAKCREIGAYFTQVYTSHVHCDWRALDPDPAFFGPTPQAPQLGSYEKTLHTVRQTGVIEYSLTQSHLILRASVFQEDPEELAFAWRVKTPDGQVLAFSEPSAVLARTAGTYHVRVEIGGNVTLQKQIHIPSSSGN